MTENESNAASNEPLDDESGDGFDYFPGDVSAPCVVLEKTQTPEAIAYLKRVACQLIGDGFSADDVKLEGTTVVVGERRATFETERSARAHAYCVCLAILDVLSRMISDRNARRLGI